MTKFYLSLLVSFLTLSVAAQTHLYENPAFDKIAKEHQMIAVVPFDATVSLRPKQMKDISPEQLQRMEQSEGESVQMAMYSWFLKREKREQLTVKVQDTNTTNALLKKNGITYENLTEYTPEELAKLLEVDAVVSGKFETSKPMSEGASIALGALIGFWGSTNKAVLNMFIHNAADGQLLINYNKGVSGSVGSSTEDLINILLRKASRRIAYTK
ncbi:hypothetical protein [Sunxiuqinia dokdonensis]|uniref:Secreted protein n=1 Tax=Sunxiuqinia dokdonensis TaxID=1409788 RepID=A0A0L8V6V2_9BACT|nr:hypothetical protein [Sunxiuqinia dokdonensis]KOH44156.1 hypothetical protein NC99_31490 [Sunxiuqinia dokdonensis]